MIALTTAECKAKGLGLSACAETVQCPTPGPGKVSVVEIDLDGVRCEERDGTSAKKAAALLAEASAKAKPPTSPLVFVAGAAALGLIAYVVLK